MEKTALDLHNQTRKRAVPVLISVVIPHFNQPEYLRICLRTLHNQDAVAADVEIIVVDNGSEAMPAEVCAGFPGVMLLRETTPGPGPARNCGVARARGDILAFIDADCHAHPGWLAAIEAAFRDPGTQIVGGDVRVNILDPDNPTALEAYESIYAYRNKMYVSQGYSGTGNLATRPDIIADVGGFAGIGVAEDRDWGQRAGARGYHIRYLPDMIVFHPARRSFAELARKWDRHIAHDYEERRPGLAGRLRWFARAAALAGSPLFEIFRIARSDRVGSLHERRLALVCLVRIRLYRAWAMIRITLARDKAEAKSDWTRT